MSYGPGFVATVAATLPTQTSAERPTSTGERTAVRRCKKSTK